MDQPGDPQWFHNPPPPPPSPPPLPPPPPPAPRVAPGPVRPWLLVSCGSCQLNYSDSGGAKLSSVSCWDLLWSPAGTSSVSCWDLLWSPAGTSRDNKGLTPMAGRMGRERGDEGRERVSGKEGEAKREEGRRGWECYYGPVRLRSTGSRSKIKLCVDGYADGRRRS